MPKVKQVWYYLGAQIQASLLCYSDNICSIPELRKLKPKLSASNVALLLKKRLICGSIANTTKVHKTDNPWEGHLNLEKAER